MVSVRVRTIDLKKVSESVIVSVRVEVYTFPKRPVKPHFVAPAPVGVPDGTLLREIISPAVIETVCVVSFPVVAVFAIVTTQAESAPATTNVNVHDLPEEGAVFTLKYQFLRMKVSPFSRPDSDPPQSLERVEKNNCTSVAPVSGAFATEMMLNSPLVVAVKAEP